MLARQLPPPISQLPCIQCVAASCLSFYECRPLFSITYSLFCQKVGGYTRKRAFSGDRDGGGDQRFRSVREAQLRCWAHQARHASGCAEMVAPVMSRNAWKTQPRVTSSRVISSVIFSSCGTARSLCSRVNIPDCANPQPPRSRTSGEGSLRKASSKGDTVSSVPNKERPSMVQ